MKERMVQLSEKVLNILAEIMEDKSIDALIRIEVVQIAMDYAHPFLSLNNPEQHRHYRKKNFFPKQRLHHDVNCNSKEDIIRF